MDTSEAASLARRLMNHHNLGGWYFEYDRALRRAGVCHYRQRKIGLSYALTKSRPIDEVTDTILHEIAHALTPGHGHDAVWRAKATEIGCDGQRLYETAEENRVPPKWIGICPGCGQKIKRHRRREIACSRCCGSVYDERFKFVWTANDISQRY